MSSPIVSIIVPCYNQAEFLEETLNSVLSQSYFDWECIIVNDGSNDNCHVIADNYRNKDNRFKYIEQTHSGPSSARNNGIKVSSGEFILPLDADDIIATTYIEKAISVFEKFPNTSLVYCKAELFGEENGPWKLPKYNYESFIWENCIFCSAFFKKSDFIKTKGYNPNMIYGYEDWDLWLSLLGKESIVFQIDEILFYYRKKKRSRDVDSNNFLPEMCRQIYKNHPDIYRPYVDSIIIMKRQLIQDVMSSEYKMQAIYNSNAYRLGHLLLSPFSMVKQFFKKIFI